MNILVLTNEYPNNNYPKPDSPWILPFFAREWVKQGNKVTVIVNSSRFPALFYLLVKFVKGYFSNKFNITASNLSDKTWSRPFSFDDMGVKVFNSPMLKIKPGGAFKKCVVKRQLNKIEGLLLKENFIPDVITGHWLNPQLMLVAGLGQIYHCRTAFVFHSDYTKEKLIYFRANKYIGLIDRIGCRSIYAANEIKKNLSLQTLPFVCYSGVANEFVERVSDNTVFNQEPSSFDIITAARLVNYKNINSVIEAVEKIKNTNVTVRIVGDGPLRDDLTNLASSLGLSNRITFMGKISRDKLQEEMHRCMMFVLISEHEVFGLVYLEAMLQGCIVIASRESGVDGIIVDGVNGFLCESGNSEELSNIITKVAKMSIPERKQISAKAQQTALNFSDSKVAERYLKDIS